MHEPSNVDVPADLIDGRKEKVWRTAIELIEYDATVFHRYVNGSHFDPDQAKVLLQFVKLITKLHHLRG